MKNKYISIIQFLIILLLSCNQKSEEIKNKYLEEIHLIPKGYIGKIVIIYNKKDGKPVYKYENNIPVLKIPENGVLITKSKFYYYPFKIKYYYVDKKGNREKLKELEDYKSQSNEVVVFGRRGVGCCPVRFRQRRVINGKEVIKHYTYKYSKLMRQLINSDEYIVDKMPNKIHYTISAINESRSGKVNNFYKK